MSTDETNSGPEATSAEPTDGAGSRHRRLRIGVGIVALLMALVVVAGTIGPPLVGRGVFHGADVVFNFEPWRTDRPVDLDTSYGPVGDTVDGTMPARIEYGERARDGEIAWWNPYISGGTPLFSIFAGGVASPLNLPSALLPSEMIGAATKLLEMAVAGGFTFLLLRRLGLRRPWAVLGGTMFMTSGFAVAWTSWPQPQVAATIPVVFWAAERHLQLRTTRSAVPVALAVAVIIAGGFPAVAGWGLMLVAAWVATRFAIGLMRGPRRQAVIGAVTTAGMFALGAALIAAVLVTFLDHLGSQDLGWRDQSEASTLGFQYLATTVVPDALGSAMDGNYFGGKNPMEALSFLGVVTVALAAFAVLLRTPKDAVRGARTFFAAALAVTVVLIYIGGPLLEMAQKLPVFENNFIGRLRSVMGLEAACLAAFGAQSLVDGRTPRSWQRWSVGIVAALLIPVTLAVAFLDVNEMAQAVGERWYVARKTAFPALIGLTVLAIGGWLLITKARMRTRRYVAMALPVLFAVEALLLVVPRFPRIEEDHFYPETATHAFLAANLGADRMLASDLTMYPGTNTIYDIRSVTGHAHHQAGWADMLRTVDPEVFGRSPTFSIIRHDLEVATSPILDRMAARYYVTSGGHPPFGTPGEPDGEALGTVDLQDDPQVTMPSQPIRGLLMDLEGTVDPTGAMVIIDVEIEADDGTVATGRRRMLTPTQGQLHIAVPGEHLPSEGDMTIRISVADEFPPVPVLATTGGDPVITPVLPDDDGLTLVMADGASVYERAAALDRIRWASEAIVEPDPAGRLELLADGLPADAVLLPGDPVGAAGLPAGVTVVEDGHDRISVEVDADGAGYLVVADALQHGWSASVDGEPAELIAADQGLVAVAVPEGEHVVTLRYDPDGQQLGFGVSIAAWLVVTALLVWPVAVRRLRGRIIGPLEETPDGASAAGTDTPDTPVPPETPRHP